MGRVVTAAFSPGCRFTQAQGSLWQYDYGTVLHLKGLELPASVEIHFATVERGGESETRIGITADGVTEVKIPDARQAVPITGLPAGDSERKRRGSGAWKEPFWWKILLCKLRKWCVEN